MSEKEVRILTIEGKLVKRFSAIPDKEKSLDISTLVNGVYLVAWGSSVQKLFIQR